MAISFRKSIRLFSIICLGGLEVSGCAIGNEIAKWPIFDKTRVDTADKAGSSHVAVLAVARWEKYRTSIQPVFSLTTDQALTDAIPDVAQISRASLSSVSGSISAQLSAGAGTPPAPPAAIGDVTSLPSTPMESPSQLGLDPMLRYWAATALYEEVQIVNKYISDAAVAGKYYPYLVRMQVTLMPKRRDLPYDAYTSIGFFNDDFADYPPARRYVSRASLRNTIECIAAGQTDGRRLRTALLEKLEGIPRKDDNHLDGFSVVFSKVAVEDGLTIAVSAAGDDVTERHRITDQERDDLTNARQGADDADEQVRQWQVAADQATADAENADEDRARTAVVAARSNSSEQRLALKMKDAAAKVKDTAAENAEAYLGEAQKKKREAHEKFDEAQQQIDSGRTFDGEIMESALGYARDRSPQFAAFRGYNEADYISIDKFRRNVNAISYDQPDRPFKTLLDFFGPDQRTQIKDRLDCALNKSAFVPNPNNVSLEDFEIAINEASDELDQMDGEQWNDRVNQILDFVAIHLGTARPFLPGSAPTSPYVVPLLVTDDLQAAIESRSAEQVRQIAISLAAVAGAANIGGGLTGLDEQLRSTLGRSLDSTFTIARQADDILRARFGASQQAGEHYAMIPDAHNVTLLVLVPKDYVDSVQSPMIHLQSKTVFEDAEVDRRLDDSQIDANTAEYDIEIDKILADDGLPTRSHELKQHLMQAAYDNDFDDFQTLAGGPKYPVEEAWVDLLALLNKSSYAYVTLHLPKPIMPEIQRPPIEPSKSEIDIAAIDDTKKSTTVSVLGKGDLFADRISAELIVIPKTEPAPSPTVQFAVTPVEPVVINTTQPTSITLGTDPNPAAITLSPANQTGVTISAQSPEAVKFDSQSSVQLKVNSQKQTFLTVGAPPPPGTPGTDKSPKAPVVFLSTLTAVAADNRSITFTFPSLAAGNLATKTSQQTLKLRVHFYDIDGHELPQPQGFPEGDVPLAYVQQKPADLPISVTQHAKVIDAAANGTGDVIVTVGGYDPTASTAKYYLTVDGADINTRITPVSTSAKTAGTIPITANGDVDISLENLNPTANVTISAEDDSGNKLANMLTFTVDRIYRFPTTNPAQ